MASTDGVRRFKTYGKHRSQVAVSRRDWWSAVGESAVASTSTFTAAQDSHASYGNDDTSPSQRAAKKGSAVVELDEDEDSSPAVKKKVPLPRAPSRSTNTRSRIVDINDSDSEEEYKPSKINNHQKLSTVPAHEAYTADTPAAMAINLAAKAPEQQRQRVISLSSDTSEEDKIKPARRKTAHASQTAPTNRKRIIIDETPPASPELDLPLAEHVHDFQDEAVEVCEAPIAKSQPIIKSPTKVSKPTKPSVLGRKDSNHFNPVGAASPFRKQSSKVSTPMQLPTKLSDASKENAYALSRKTLPSSKQATADKPASTPLKTSSYQASAHRLQVANATSRSSAATKSSSSSSSSMHRPPPRGHNSQSSVPWRRPLVPIIPIGPGGLKSTNARLPQKAAMRATRETPVTSPVSRKFAANSIPIQSAVSVGSQSSQGSQSSRNVEVVVEIPFGLPRSRSPAPSMKEPRRRQLSYQSTGSSSSASSAIYRRPPLAPEKRRESSDYASSEAQLSPEPSVEYSTPSRQKPAQGASVHIPQIPTTPNQDVPKEIGPLLGHCDGLTSTNSAEVLDFAAFVATPSPLLPNALTEENVAQWHKLGEATFSEVFIVNSGTDPIDPQQAKGTVVKVIPLHMSPVRTAEEEKVEEAFAKGEEKVEEAFTSSIEDLAREIRIFRALSKQEKAAKKGWPGFKGAYIVKGAYPEELLSAWDDFKVSNPKRAENPRPDTFAANQMYALICMEHAGTDLESIKLKTWSEAATILWQVSLALSEAEATLDFEHRDLHWGNILVQRTLSEPGLAEELDREVSSIDLPECLATVDIALSATIIDFTLSRATVPVSTHSPMEGDLEALSGGFDDEWMFTGEGDYQYECYRIMKRLVQNYWEPYCPATNLVWLHYLVKKLLHDKGLKKPVQRNSTRSIVIKASLPGTPLRSRTRRGTSAGKKVPKSSNTPQASAEKLAYEALVKAETILANAIATSLRSLPKSTSLVQMMDSIRIDTAALDASDEDSLGCAGDFVSWWRDM